MLGESTAHRAYILEVDRNRNGTKERVTLLVDYGRNQARVELAVTPAFTRLNAGRQAGGLPQRARGTRRRSKPDREIAARASMDVRLTASARVIRRPPLFLEREVAVAVVALAQ